MKTLFKLAIATTLTGALALAAISPSEARDGHNAAAIGIGIGAGVLAGATIVNSRYGYYGSGYYAEPGYAPGYYAEPGYAYEPVYVEPAPTYYYSGRSQRGTRNCSSSPASMNFGANC